MKIPRMTILVVHKLSMYENQNKVGFFMSIFYTGEFGGRIFFVWSSPPFGGLTS